MVLTIPPPKPENRTQLLRRLYHIIHDRHHLPHSKSQEYRTFAIEFRRDLAEAFTPHSPLRFDPYHSCPVDFREEHIARNLRVKFKGPKEDLTWKFRKASRAATEAECEEYLQMLDEQDHRIRAYLSNIGQPRWARCKSGPYRYSVMTSNAAESMNNVNNSPREYPICKLVDFISERMQKWFHERFETTSSTTTILPRKLKSDLITLQREAFRMKVKPASPYKFEVVDRWSRTYIVNLRDKSCICGDFQLDHFVCVHAVAAIGSRPGLSCYNFISTYYKRESLVATYSGIVHPIGNQSTWYIPPPVKALVCKPPSCNKRPPGRPKKRRLPSVGEFHLGKVHPHSNDATTHNDHNFHNEAYVNSVCNANLQSNTYSTPQRSGSGILGNGSSCTPRSHVHTQNATDPIPQGGSSSSMDVISHYHPTTIRVDGIYKSKDDLCKHLQMYAVYMSNSFQYRTKRSNKSCLHVVCDDDRCSWTLRAVRIDNSPLFQIRRFDSIHTCPVDFREGDHRHATSSFVADILLHRYVDATKKPYPPNDLREDMRREYGVSMSYRKALLVKQKALTKLYGSDEDSYQLLPSMCFMLEQKNPDKVFPNVEHGYCTEHIARNIRGKFKGPKEDLAWKFRQACRAAIEFEREEYLQMLDVQDSRIRSYLWDIGESKWSRCKSGPFRYSIMTSNAAESMNNVSNSAREYPVSKLVDFIRERMQKWFHERHERALSTKTILTQNLESELISLQRDAFKMKLLRLALVCHVMISSHRTTDGNH
ncbi:unnamed protein product [Cuscuta campestris]|uniref:SWIM-type domain-containing protein n=1 Tax=Cuscuta campestris TaxID=132261 RepID=A0A484L1A0_9ASTE|nr:unnamed protein product [Cuscuta campestris]